MSFFRTKERSGDRSVGESARAQRRQQLQMPQQLLAREKAASAEPVMAGTS
jgi:hypothetical protein